MKKSYTVKLLDKSGQTLSVIVKDVATYAEAVKHVSTGEALAKMQLVHVTRGCGYSSSDPERVSPVMCNVVDRKIILPGVCFLIEEHHHIEEGDEYYYFRKYADDCKSHTVYRHVCLSELYNEWKNYYAGNKHELRYSNARLADDERQHPQMLAQNKCLSTDIDTATFESQK